MNLKQLEAFVEVAEKNSFSKAAKSLYLTQPTVSAHISALEKELGSRLLIRNTKEVELSESGKRLYEYAKQIVLLTAQIEQEFGKKEKRGVSEACIRWSSSAFLRATARGLSRKWRRAGRISD